MDSTSECGDLPAPTPEETHTIAVAMGMLMERHRVGRREAEQLLRNLAWGDGLSLVKAASVVINTKF